jgi:hypothetical protein
LDEETKTAYDQILNGILNHADVITLSTKDADVLAKAYDCILIDYGGLFWVSGYQYNTYSSFGNVVGLEFEPNYVYSAEETEELQSQVDTVVEEWLSGISADASDYDKTKFVFETLIESVDYNLDSRDNQNILSVFLYGETVCQGYADAAQYLLERLGVPTAIITGTADGSNHAWNLVQLDGAYYYMDVTWGNSKYHSTDDEEVKTVNYAYLNITSQDIALNHQSNVVVELPESTSMEDTYFVQEGLYFSSFSGKEIGRRIQQSWYAGDSRVSIKLADEDAYREALTYFITNSRIFDYCPTLSSISYLADDKMGIITFIFS